MSEKIRSFLAIELEDSLKENVLKIQNEFKKNNGSLKYVNPQNMHITLKFFGYVTNHQIKELSAIIEKVISKYNSFNLDLKGCGAFPSENHIKVLWVGIENTEVLMNIHEELDSEFQKLGFSKDKSFKSHLTIARVKNPKNKDLIINTLKNNKEFPIGNMNVSKIVLKKSTLTPQGPIYEDLKVFDVMK